MYSYQWMLSIFKMRKKVFYFYKSGSDIQSYWCSRNCRDKCVLQWDRKFTVYRTPFHIIWFYGRYGKHCKLSICMWILYCRRTTSFPPLKQANYCKQYSCSKNVAVLWLFLWVVYSITYCSIHWSMKYQFTNWSCPLI